VLLAETLAVREDEPCFLLVEANLQSPGNRGWHRYQVLTVVRDDRLAQAHIDLGPRERFTAPPFRVLGGVQDETTGRLTIEHTVGELRDIADVQRGGHLPVPEALLETSDLMNEYRDLQDRRRKARANQSLFGPAGHHQRNA
jgi:hypothetical protein